MRRKYPELYDRAALLALQAEYGTDTEIARKLGCSVPLVCEARNALGIPKTAQYRWAVLNDRAAFLALQPYERRAREIAAEIGCSRSAVLRARARFRARTKRSP